MRKGLLAATAALIVFNVPAQEVVLHKCLDGSGVPIYQSKPCAAGQESAGVVRDWVYRSPEKTAAMQRRRQRERAGARNLERLASRGGGPKAHVIYQGKSGDNSGGCAAAKRQRAQVRKTLGLDLTYDTASRLDEAVRKACR